MGLFFELVAFLALFLAVVATLSPVLFVVIEHFIEKRASRATREVDASLSEAVKLFEGLPRVGDGEGGRRGDLLNTLEALGAQLSEHDDDLDRLGLTQRQSYEQRISQLRARASQAGIDWAPPASHGAARME